MKRFIKKAAAFTVVAQIILGSYAFAESNDFLILVNQSHPVGEHYEPVDLDNVGNYAPTTRVVNLRHEAVSSYNTMYSAMKSEGAGGLLAISGHRPYWYQKNLFDSDINYYMGLGYSYDSAYKITKSNVAVPGESEHQTGLAMDVSTDGNLSKYFGNTVVGAWLRENSYKYGFILRYNHDKVGITGINFEPWHFRYVGYPHSEIMYKNNFSLEEYTDYVANTQDFFYYADNGEEFRITYRVDSNTDGVANVTGISSNNSGGYVITSKPATDLPEPEGYIKGFNNNEFRPDVNMTRAEAATIISRAIGDYNPDIEYSAEYSDVKEDSWYKNIIGYMSENNIIEGYKDGSFRPDNKITRAEFSSIISRVKELKIESKSSFKDIDNHWAESDILKLKNNNWINGYFDNSFKPDAPIKRSEAVKLVNSVIELNIDTTYIDHNLSTLKRFKDLGKEHWAYYEIMTATNIKLSK